MLIGKKLVDEEKIRELILAIKQKKELQQISNDFVRDHVYSYFQQNPQRISELANPRSQKYKQIIKEVRAKLRRIYSLFRTTEEGKERRELFEEWLQGSLRQRRKTIEKILATHASTRERVSYYPQLYDKIFSITGKPTKLIDLGCGINPFSLPFMKLQKCTYYAYDISIEEVELLDLFFQELHKKNVNFAGHAAVLDALQMAKLAKLKEVDLCFLFKMTDVLDQGKGHKVTEKVLQNIPARVVVVSFPTLTMSGRKMNYPRRKWIELMCHRLGYHYRTLEFENEIFYMIKKK